nr:hypothetical protein [Tanacetum cinerariifolium]
MLMLAWMGAISKMVLTFLSISLATTSSAVLGGKTLIIPFVSVTTETRSFPFCITCHIGYSVWLKETGGEVLEVSGWSPSLSSPTIENSKVKVYSKSVLVLLIQSSLEALIPLLINETRKNENTHVLVQSLEVLNIEKKRNFLTIDDDITCVLYLLEVTSSM